MKKFLPLHAVPLGIRATATAIEAAVGAAGQAATAAVDTAGSVASAALDLAARPAREVGKVLAGQTSVATATRRSWQGDNRIWIEVRGLDGPEGSVLGAAVLDALQGQPGVTAVRLNRPLARAVVDVDGTGADLDRLCTAVADAEQRHPAAGGDTPTRTDPLPGDGLLLAVRGAMVGANAAGLAIAVAGRALRWPRGPVAVDAVASLANYQPWVRGLLAPRIGSGATDTVLSLTSTVAHVITLSPATLTVDLVVQGLRAAESRAGEQAWIRHEPTLARHSSQDTVYRPTRPVPASDGPLERHGRRVAWVQALGAGLVGALSRNAVTTANAAVVAAPKAMRTTNEAFAATLGRGLADQHEVLALQPASLRRLHQVDALLIDPRVLCQTKLRVVQVRGAAPAQLPAAWAEAQRLLDDPDLRPGWHPVTGVPRAGRSGRIEAQVLPALHPLANAVVSDARAIEDLMLASVDIGILGRLRTAFDEIPTVGRADGGDDAIDDASDDEASDDEAIDAAIVETLVELQRAGRTVAVLSASAGQALCSADLGLGLIAADREPPWQADLLLPSLAAAWHVLHALPAAKEAAQQGISISIGASSMGALFMVPGVRRPRGRGPGPVTLGAAAGLISGHLLARRTLGVRPPTPAPSYDWHAMSVEQVRDVLMPDGEENGVAAAFVTPPEPEPSHPVVQFARAVRAELADPLTPVLALCSAATAVLGSPIDAMMVGTVLTGNAMLAAGQRLRAESRLNLLLAQQAPPARQVVANGDGQAYRDVPTDQLQPGDVIEVRSNEVVPADARVITEADLEVDESSLTGESLSVNKQVAATPGAELAERRCMLYAGTTVVTGTATAMVTAVGAGTQARRATELASGELPEVGLQHQLSQLMARAFPVSAGGGVLVGALGLLRGGGLRQALGNAIAVAIAAVPEGMPLMATLAQHASARRLSGSGALVRVPRSVEALGRLNVVCFDKTGTLSENRLRVTAVQALPGHTSDDVLVAAMQAAPAPEEAQHAHATDQAIIEGAAGVEDAPPWREPDVHLPFRSGRAFSASVCGAHLTVKGAPEVVLAACSGLPEDIDDTVTGMATQGLRVIAVAQRELSARQVATLQDDPDAIADVSGAGLRLIGFLGLADTPRPQSPRLLADLADRGVSVRMITGDHPVTATAIAGELGVPVSADQVITGSEWNALSRKEQERAAVDRIVFARMSPENKVQIVQTLERTGKVCAMVGDGANDAAAIRAATVGIGVVARGSDAAHATADLVLTDGRIEALVAAVDEGRRLWRGVQTAVSGLLGGNAGEVIFSIIGTALTGNSPLNTRQLLLMNTLTDALPATAVAVSTPAGPVQRVAFGMDERALWRAVAFRGAVTAAAGTTAWAMAALTGTPQRASTVALISLVTTELGQTVVDSQAPLVLLTAAGSFAAFALMVSTPGVSQLLGCTPVGPLGWAQALSTAGAATAAVAVAGGVSAARQRAAAPATDEQPTAEAQPDAGSARPEPGRRPGTPRHGSGPTRSSAGAARELVGPRN